jgi:hypothetical protein
MQEELVERLVALGSATMCEGAFAPVPAVLLHRRVVAHVDADGSLDVGSTRAVIRRLTLRPTTSDRLDVRLSGPDELQWAVDLVGAVIDATAPGTPGGEPPTGTALGLRRRFH